MVIFQDLTQQHTSNCFCHRTSNRLPHFNWVLNLEISPAYCRNGRSSRHRGTNLPICVIWTNYNPQQTKARMESKGFIKVQTSWLKPGPIFTLYPAICRSLLFKNTHQLWLILLCWVWLYILLHCSDKYLVKQKGFLFLHFLLRVFDLFWLCEWIYRWERFI